MGGDEQPAGGAGHRKADALQDMGGFSDAEIAWRYPIAGTPA